MGVSTAADDNALEPDERAALAQHRHEQGDAPPEELAARISVCAFRKAFKSGQRDQHGNRNVEVDSTVHLLVAVAPELFAILDSLLKAIFADGGVEKNAHGDMRRGK